MAETKTINLEVQSNLGSLKSQLREAQAEVAALSDKFGATSAEAANAAKRAAELKDRIGDAKALTDAFNPDAKFNALSSSIGGVLNGFQAYEGAMGLIGIESEALQKTLLKVQSAMALSQGIQGALEAKDSFIQLGAVVKNAFAGMSAASKAFAVTGIGLLVTAVGVLIANYDEWFGKGEQVKKQQEAMAEAAKKQREQIASESAEFSTLISRLKQTNEGSKEREDLIKKVNNQYGTTLKNIKDETEFQKQLNVELASYLEYQKAKFALQANEDLIQKNLQKQMSIKDRLNKLEEENNRLVKEGALVRKDTYETDDMGRRISTGVGYANEQAAGQVEKNRKQIEKLNDELAAAEKRFENYGSAANKAQAKVDVLTENGKKYVEQIAPTKEKADEMFNPTVQAFDESVIDMDEGWTDWNDKKATQREKEIEEQKAYDQLILDSQLQLQQDLTDAELARIKEIEDAEAEKQRKFKENLQTSIELSIKGLDLIANIAEMNAGEDVKRQKRAFNIRKAANIASATMDGYNAVLSTFAETKGGIVLKSIAASIAGGFAALQIAGIAKTKFDGGGSTSSSGGIGGGGISGGSAAQAPSFNVVGNSGMNQLAQIQQTPMQAYVVSGEVTSAQALDRNRIKNATL